MDDFIKRSDALKVIESANRMVSSLFEATMKLCVTMNSITAADVAPVRHGRWVKTIGENGVTSACRCNLCGFEDNRFSLFNYCPNCGALMDKDGDGDV